MFVSGFVSLFSLSLESWIRERERERESERKRWPNTAGGRTMQKAKHHQKREEEEETARLS